MMTERRRWVLDAACALAIVGAAACLTAPEGVRLLAFCGPAAHGASWLSGAPCVAESGGYRLLGRGLDLQVSPACAAADFCCLLAGFLSLLVAWRRWPRRCQWGVLPAAWALTIAINAVRLTACWQADLWARAALPMALWPGVHMAAGTATFLLGMTAVFWVMTRPMWRQP